MHTEKGKTMREKLIELVCESVQSDNCVAYCNHPHCNMVQAIVQNLIANGVTIPVRCKDCIHWYEPDGVCLKIYSDGHVSPYAWQDRNPDDFCSYGERKTDG